MWLLAVANSSVPEAHHSLAYPQSLEAGERDNLTEVEEVGVGGEQCLHSFILEVSLRHRPCVGGGCYLLPSL